MLGLRKNREKSLVDKNSFRKKSDNFVLELIKVIIISLAIILPVRYYLIQPFIVKGDSMEPNFSDGDYLIVDEFSYRFKEPQRGEVVIFKYPKDTSQYYIKRIIGLPEETVEIDQGKIIIYNQDHPDGFQLKESYLTPNLLTPGDLKISIPQDKFFVLGDNRIASSDSRVWGLLPKNDIIGRAWIRGLPLAKATIFEPFIYPQE